MYVSEYFMRGQRSQYAGEGYIAATIAFFISFSFLGMVKSENFLKGSGERKIGLMVLICVGYVLV
jgi:hypothetical protein